MHKKRIMVVDDSPEIRRVVEAWIDAEADGCEIVGTARDGYEAINLAANLLPDVILMDLNLPMMDGAKATELITDAFPDIEVIGMSASGDINRLLKAGASAAYHKTDLRKALDRAGC